MTDRPRITFSTTPEMLDEIEEYRFKNRITTQSGAVQQLIHKGILSLGQKNPPSARENGLNSQEWSLIKTVRELGPAQRALLLRLVETAVDVNAENQRNQ